MYVSTSLSQHKARSSARWRRPTLVFERLVAKGPFYAYLPSLDDVVAVRGGNPLVVGGKVIGAKQLMHGKVSTVTADGESVFIGIPSPFQAMRYHSLVVSREHLPPCLTITAEAEDGEIMGIRHRKHRTEGIQFHPESIMTPVGKRLLRNFLVRAKAIRGENGS